MDKVEQLNVNNIIEVQRMRVLLKEHPDLLSLFEVMLVIINTRINDEKVNPH